MSQEKTTIIVGVAVAVPLRQTFDFLASEPANSLVVGARVLVPFGARKLVGIVHSVKQKSDYPLAKIKPILKLIDTESLFDQALWETVNWAAQYYL